MKEENNFQDWNELNEEEKNYLMELLKKQRFSIKGKNVAMQTTDGNLMIYINYKENRIWTQD